MQEKNSQTCRLLKAIIVVPNEKTRDYGCLLAVARAVARKREHEDKNPTILAMSFLPDLRVYVAVYEGTQVQKPQEKSMNG